MLSAAQAEGGFFILWLLSGSEALWWLIQLRLPGVGGQQFFQLSQFMCVTPCRHPNVLFLLSRGVQPTLMCPIKQKRRSARVLAQRTREKERRVNNWKPYEKLRAPWQRQIGAANGAESSWPLKFYSQQIFFGQRKILYLKLCAHYCRGFFFLIFLTWARKFCLRFSNSHCLNFVCSIKCVVHETPLAAIISKFLTLIFYLIFWLNKKKVFEVLFVDDY